MDFGGVVLGSYRDCIMDIAAIGIIGFGFIEGRESCMADRGIVGIAWVTVLSCRGYRCYMLP